MSQNKALFCKMQEIKCSNIESKVFSSIIAQLASKFDEYCEESVKEGLRLKGLNFNDRESFLDFCKKNVTVIHGSFNTKSFILSDNSIFLKITESLSPITTSTDKDSKSLHALIHIKREFI